MEWGRKDIGADVILNPSRVDLYFREIQRGNAVPLVAIDDYRSRTGHIAKCGYSAADRCRRGHPTQVSTINLQRTAVIINRTASTPYNSRPSSTKDEQHGPRRGESAGRECNAEVARSANPFDAGHVGVLHPGNIGNRPTDCMGVV